MGLDITRYHHEKWDGSGYLAGLAGRAIPLSARIMALADVYDALRSRRVYKEPYSHEKSLGIIQEGRGKHFDPVLVDLFLENEREFEALYALFS
jgi:putative two-component system response regulator